MRQVVWASKATCQLAQRLPSASLRLSALCDCLVDKPHSAHHDRDAAQWAAVGGVGRSDVGVRGELDDGPRGRAGEDDLAGFEGLSLVLQGLDQPEDDV